MTAREFLTKFINELPSRGLDNIDVYIYSTPAEWSYPILNISNEGSNDWYFYQN